jgi:hypothetical protein
MKVEVAVEGRGKISETVIVMVYSVQPGASGTLGPLLVPAVTVVGDRGGRGVER